MILHNKNARNVLLHLRHGTAVGTTGSEPVEGPPSFNLGP